MIIKKFSYNDILILNIFEFRMLRQLTRLGARSGVTGSCRSMKTQGGQGDRGHVPTAFNHKDGVGRGGFTKQKDDFMSHSKKTETLAYPEDAIINVESSTEVRKPMSNRR